MSVRWRLLRETDGDGAWNMAVDEVLLDGYTRPVKPDRPPTLRLYGWTRPTLSLGRHQGVVGNCDRGFLRSEGIDLVRRPTGGSGVLHEHERTYAVLGPLDLPFSGSVRETYRRIEKGLIEALVELQIRPRRSAVEASSGDLSGICFAAHGPHELATEGGKLVGSAQARRGRAFLQHGSIPIRMDRDRLAAAANRPGSPVPATSLTEVLGRWPSKEEIDDAIRSGFAGVFDAEWAEGALTDDERQAAHLLRRRKYLNSTWTLRAAF